MQVNAGQIETHKRLSSVLSLAAVVCPFVIVGAFILYLKLPTASLTPATSINDGVFYWHQAETFRAVGFAGGYYTTDERTPQLALSHWYAWGPFVPMFYGGIGALFGWGQGSIPVINFGVYVIALALYVWLVRPPPVGALLLLLVVATNSAFMIYAPLSMPVILNLGVAVLLAALFTRLLDGDRRISRREWAVSFLVLGAASLILTLWAGLFVFLLMLRVRRGRPWQIALAGLAGLALMGGFITLVGLLSAKQDIALNSIPELLAQGDLPNALSLLWKTANGNLRVFFQESILFVGTRLQVLALLGITLGAGVLHIRSARHEQARTQARNFAWEMAFHSFNLAFVLLPAIALYAVDGFTGYRHFAPRLLLSLLVLIGRRRWWMASLFVLSMLLLAPPAFVAGYEFWSEHFDQQAAGQMDDWHRQYVEHVQYQPDAASPWCNTLLASTRYVESSPWLLAGVPAGIGLSHTSPQQTAPPYLSRYLLLDDDFYSLHASQLQVERLMAVPDGALYLNLTANCDRVPAPG